MYNLISMPQLSEDLKTPDLLLLQLLKVNSEYNWKF